jgi:hypothetical protein
LDNFQAIDFRNILRLNDERQESDSKNFRILHEPNGDIYEGEFMHTDQITKHGVGKLISKTGTIFEGIWKDN